MKRKREKGAIVIEATISLTAFIFAIFTILSLVDIAYVQAKMSVALNSAAKEISQYSYLYYKLNLDELDASLSEGTGDSKEMIENTIDGVGEVMDSLTEAENCISNGNFDKMMTAINNGTGSANEMINMYADEVSEDPKGFIIGMGKLAGSELKEEAKVVLGQVLAKAFMKKNLKAFSEQDPDAFLRKYHVVDGMDGLDFNYTTLMAYGTSNQINLVVTYDVEVMQLLNIDFKFKFQQCAKTQAWGNGISVIHPQSIWDTMEPMQAGKYIIAKEKENYTYTFSGANVEAYSNSRGKNQFIAIAAMDPGAPKYQEKSQIKYRIKKLYENMYSEVNKKGNPITVKDGAGNDVTINSDPKTRTYRMVIIVPEDSDTTLLEQVIKEYKEANPEYKLNIEIKQDYGKKQGTEKNS